MHCVCIQFTLLCFLTFFSLKCFILEMVPCLYIEICLTLFKSCVVFHYMDVSHTPVSTDGHLGVSSLLLLQNKDVIIIFLYTLLCTCIISSDHFYIKKEINKSYFWGGEQLSSWMLQKLFMWVSYFLSIWLSYQFLSYNSSWNIKQYI